MVMDAEHFYSPGVEDERWIDKQNRLSVLYNQRDALYINRDDLDDEDEIFECNNAISELDSAIRNIKNGD
ncbi:hypothetical protein CRI85_06040 [Leuconostoc pseudomesenteroides]|nr:hypothetical protein [Leuconostoc pseudomesenteroides]